MSDSDAVGRRDRTGRERPAGRDRKDRAAGLDTPRTRAGRRFRLRPDVDPESFGRGAERFARFMGTARFLVYMTAFVTVWLLWNTLAPADAQFDPRALNYTLLTLILSLQASYAAPLILLAQNRQDDRDRVQNAQDRVASERALADTEFLTREVADLKIALREVATRDFLRSELRTLLEELLERQDDEGPVGERGEGQRERAQERARDKGRDKGRGKGKNKDKRTEPPAPLDVPAGAHPSDVPRTVPSERPAPVDDPVQAPVDAPVEAQGATPVDAPAEAPVEAPVVEVPPSLSVDRAHPQGLQHRP